MNEAEIHIIRALQIHPNYMDARLNLALLLLKKNKINEATEQLIYILRYNSKLYQAYYLLGKIASIQGKYNEAIQNYQKALSINPDFDIAKNDLNNILSRQREMP